MRIHHRCCRYLLHSRALALASFFFFNDPATTEIYTLSLHDALPILLKGWAGPSLLSTYERERKPVESRLRSEEHMSELQSQFHLVCRLLLEKKNNCGALRRTTLRSVISGTMLESPCSVAFITPKSMR